MLHPQSWISFILSISSYLCFYIYRTYSKKRLNILGFAFPPCFTGDLKFFVFSSSPDIYITNRGFFLKFRHLVDLKLGKGSWKDKKRTSLLMRLYITGNSTEQWCNFLKMSDDIYAIRRKPNWVMRSLFSWSDVYEHYLYHISQVFIFWAFFSFCLGLLTFRSYIYIHHWYQHYLYHFIT